MLFGQLGLKRLAQFCGQLGRLLEAGRPIREALALLEERGLPADVRPLVSRIRSDIAAGLSLAHALEQQRHRFPALMRNLVKVGEEAGNLGGVLEQLGVHYSLQRSIRNQFLVTLIYPGFMVFMTILILSILAYVLTMLQEGSLRSPEMAALRVFLTGWGVVGAVIGMYFLVTRVLAEARPLQKLLLHIPLVGAVRRHFALARFSWAMELILRAGGSAAEGMQRALESTANGAFLARVDLVKERFSDGASVMEAIAATRLFPEDYIQQIASAEHSGQMEASFGRLANEHFRSGENAMRVLSIVMFWFIYLSIAGVMAYFILSIAMKYWVGPIRQLTGR